MISCNFMGFLFPPPPPQVMVGGKFDRCDYVVAGPPMKQIADACPLAHGGDVVLASPAWDLVKDTCSGVELEGDSGCVRVTGVLDPVVPKSLIDYETPTVGMQRLMATDGGGGSFQSSVPWLVLHLCYRDLIS